MSSEKREPGAQGGDREYSAVTHHVVRCRDLRRPDVGLRPGHQDRKEAQIEDAEEYAGTHGATITRRQAVRIRPGGEPRSTARLMW
jgi:hypothetical protein